MEPLYLHTDESIDLAAIPVAGSDSFARSLIDLVNDGGVVSALYAMPADKGFLVRAGFLRFAAGGKSPYLRPHVQKSGYSLLRKSLQCASFSNGRWLNSGGFL